MDRPWEATYTVSIDQARDLIGEQFPQLAGARIELLGFGWDNSVFSVGREWVFRFPRREIALPLLDTECRLLPVIAAHLPLPIPVPTHRGEPCGDYPWPFVGYPMLPGRTACIANLDDDTRAAVAEPLADFLSTLHSIPTVELRAIGAPADDFGRTNISWRSSTVEQRLASCVELGFVVDDAPLRRILADTPVDFRPLKDTLCHGDLYARHLLVDTAGAPTGVIDWGDIHLGDPAVDLGIADSFLPRAAADRFFNLYGDITDAQRCVARFRALHYALMLPIYGSDIGDEALVREGLTALRYLSG
jgi:aminoglycoside phosphotransferase (APT) family kinase protein